MSTTETTTHYNQTQTYVDVLAPPDETIPYRLVGTFEYLKSLENLQALISKSTSDQIKTYNEILRERPEFTFYSGMATQVPGNPQPVVFPNEDARKQFDDEFQKGGLPWMVALAKIELGATVSMYGVAKKPFSIFVPSDLDMKEFVRMTADDVVAHMKSLSQEAGFKEVLRRNRKSDTWTLAYLRRIKLIRDMLNVLFATGDREVHSRMQTYAAELKSLEKKLLIQVANDQRVQQESVGGTSTVTTSSSTTKSLSGTATSAQAAQKCSNLASRIEGSR